MDVISTACVTDKCGAATRRCARAVLTLTTVMLLSSACAMPKLASAPPDTDATPWSDDVFALSKQAESAYRDSRWIDAVRLYETLTTRVPDDSYSWFRLGNAYARQGDYDRAIPAYEASLAHNGTQPKPWFNLSSAYLLNAERAMQNAHDALRPGDPARQMIQRRLQVLGGLLHERFEDEAVTGASVSYR